MTDIAAPTAPATPVAPAAGPASPAIPAAPTQGLTPVASAEPAASTTAPAPTPEAAAPGRFTPLHDHPTSLNQKTLSEKIVAEQSAAKKGIGDNKPTQEAKPVEAAKPDEASKPAEAARSAAPAEAPLTFELPAQLKAAPEQLQEFGALVQAAKADAKASGQKLLDMHAKAMEAYGNQIVQQASENQWKVWNERIATKDQEVLADPIIGGAGHETAKAVVVRMRDLLVPESRRASFSTFLNETGAGSWPDFWHLLYSAGQIFDGMRAAGGKPAGDTRIQQPAGRFGLMHDHPSSRRAK